MDVIAVELCKRNITNTKVTIHCNSKATIMSLVMAMLNLGNIVTICWVLGHIDVQGNEKIDEPAKLGSTTLFIGAKPALPFPQCCIMRAVWQRAAAAHARIWGTFHPAYLQQKPI